jgi:hypothetical protein
LTLALNIQQQQHQQQTQSTHGVKYKDADILILRLGTPIPSRYFLPFLPGSGGGGGGGVGTVQQRLIQATSAKGKFGGWVHTYSKFWIAQYDEYDAIVFVDSDVLLLRGVEDLIDVALALPEGSIVTPQAYWYRQQPTVTTGTFVIRPSRTQGAVRRLHALLDANSTEEAIGLGEMDWFNHHLVPDNVTMVSGFYTLLTGEFYPNDGAYGYWAKQRNQTPAEVLQSAPLVHFVSRWKPWKKGIKMAKKNTTQELIDIYDIWNRLRERACTNEDDNNHTQR